MDAPHDAASQEQPISGGDGEVAEEGQASMEEPNDTTEVQQE